MDIKETIKKVNEKKISREIIKEILFEVVSPVPNMGNIVLSPVLFTTDGAKINILANSSDSPSFAKVGVVTYENETIVVNSWAAEPLRKFSISIYEEDSMERASAIVEGIVRMFS